MIYNIQTYCTYGYWPEDLKPKSRKLIIVACDRCSKVKTTPNLAYNNLCASCAAKKRYENPSEHEKSSKAALKRYEDPLEHTKTSNALKKYYEHENPSEYKKRSERFKEYFKDPVERKNRSERMKKRYEDPIEREKQSVRMRKLHELDPTIRIKISDNLKRFYTTMDDPGQQIVKHHYIYDFNDLDKYTIKITRSEHSSIHMKLRQAGLQVPCINILKSDIDD